MEKLSKASQGLLEIRQSLEAFLTVLKRSRYYRSQFNSLVAALRISSATKLWKKSWCRLLAFSNLRVEQKLRIRRPFDGTQVS
jgi:hypothetical protein